MMKQRQTSKYKQIDHKSKDSDSSNEDETELFVRNKSPKREIPSVEKDIEEGDTLQSLAIRYHCTIEDLKRLNNIHKENEIFARRKVKVPHRPFSEALVSIHVNETDSSIGLDGSSTSKLVDTNVIGFKLESTEIKQNNEVNRIIFNSNVKGKSIEKQDDEIIFGEDVCLLPEQSDTPKLEPIISRLSCNGSDWDISYPALIVCIVLVIFAVPLIYVFYIAEHPEIYKNHTHKL
ncbi:hypothetical protein ABEB36_003034 [Hypothenemus hampei]|uniref:LysM domain-containing protein n=1 Tax=Hypothenemus hampei TaxID=57062 RepID=A0ABD1F8G6_HYPHA